MKKTGFTLIELLATIVLLSIISLIVTPIVYGTLESSRKQSFKISCENIYNSASEYILKQESNGVDDICVTFDFEKNLSISSYEEGILYEPISKLNLKNEIPKRGTYRICNDKKTLTIDNDRYTCIMNNSKAEILDGTISDNDTTPPVINEISLTSTMNSIKVYVNAVDNDGEITKYYYKIENKTFESNSNNYVFTGLEVDKEYEVIVIVENKSGLKSNAVSKKIVTETISKPSITLVSKTPASGYTYSTSKTVKVEYNGTGITSPIYYVKSSVAGTITSGSVVNSCGTGTMPSTCSGSTVTSLSGNTWYKVTGNVEIKYTTNGTVYALTSDGVNTSGTSTYEVTKIDTSKPSISIAMSNVKTDRATITATCSDPESGITKYEYSKDGGTTWETGTGNSYTYTGLKSGTKYTYVGRCTNGSGISNTATTESSTAGMNNPSITLVSKTPASGYTYSTSKTVKVEYNGTGITSPIYYVKSSVAGTITSGSVVNSCGTGTMPSTCSGSTVTSLSGNTWYKVTGNVEIKYTTNGTVYALTSDGVNTSGTSTYEVTKISTGTPTTPKITGGNATWTTGSRTISVSNASTETSGIMIYQYYLSTSSTTQTGGSWINCSTSTSSQTITTNGQYYVYFRAVANNGNVSAASNYQIVRIASGSYTKAQFDALESEVKNSNQTNITNINSINSGANSIDLSIYATTSELKALQDKITQASTIIKNNSDRLTELEK